MSNAPPTTFINLLRDAATDIVADHDDGESHYLHTENGWRPISRFAYDDLVEVGVDVRLMRVER